MTALIIVDFQNDYIEGGPLAFHGSLQLVSKINQVKEKFKNVIFTRDWHPHNHSSFKKYGGDLPTHCVQDTLGAQIPSSIVIGSTDTIINKGMLQKYDTESVFYNAQNITEDSEYDQPSLLDSYLKKNNITTLYFCGTDADNRIFSSILSAIKLDYKIVLISDLVTFSNIQNYSKVINFLQKLNVKILTTNFVLDNKL